MKAIAYASEAKVEFTARDLKELGDRAQLRNQELGVTGYLYYENGRFFQYLEGDDQTVTDLMTRIADDPRHTVIHQVSSNPLKERRFPAWSMRSFQRRNFVGLEALLTEHLGFMKRLRETEAGVESLVWQMVQQLSDMQHRLA